MFAPFRLAVFLAFAIVLVTPAAYGLAEKREAQVPARLKGGEKLYRKFCGQCHELREARAVGFGSARKGSVGDLGGPSFNELRVPAHFSVLAVTGTWDGHSKVMTLITRDQLRLVADYLQAATKDHKYKAVMPSDMFR